MEAIFLNPFKIFKLSKRTFFKLSHFINFQWCSFQTIDWVQRIEDDFFPVIAGELGSSMQNTKHFEKLLEDFQPSVQVTHL